MSWSGRKQFARLTRALPHTRAGKRPARVDHGVDASESRLHDVIYRVADLPFIEQLSKSARRTSLRAAIWAPGGDDRLSCARGGTSGSIERRAAPLARSADGARALARAHVLSSFRLLRTILEQVGVKPGAGSSRRTHSDNEVAPREVAGSRPAGSPPLEGPQMPGRFLCAEHETIQGVGLRSLPACQSVKRQPCPAPIRRRAERNGTRGPVNASVNPASEGAPSTWRMCFRRFVAWRVALWRNCDTRVGRPSWSYVGLLLGASSRRSDVWLRRFRETCLFAGILRTAVSEGVSQACSRCLRSHRATTWLCGSNDCINESYARCSSLPRRSARRWNPEARSGRPLSRRSRLAIPLVEALPAFAQRAPVPESRQGR